MSRLEVRAARLLLSFLTLLVLLEGGLWLHLLLDPTHAPDRAAISRIQGDSPAEPGHHGEHAHPHPGPAHPTPAPAGHDHEGDSIGSPWLPYHRTGPGPGVEIPVEFLATAPIPGPFQIARSSRPFRAVVPPGTGPAGRHRVLLI